MANSLIILTLTILVGGLGFFCYEALGQSDFFQITDIEIEGYQHLSKKKILELSGVNVHSNLVKISIGQVKQTLEGHNWIERARIDREWPDRLIISVRERKPVAIVNLDDGLHYIDSSAEVFAPVEQRADLDYPVISGLKGKARGLQMETAGVGDALLMIKYASRNNPNLPVQNISEISIRSNDLVLFLMDRPFPISLGNGDMWEKYNRLVEVLYWLYKQKEFDRVSYVYVDYSADKVLVGMGAG